MNIALCYESVLPTRGGCETYIASLAHRLVADGHEVHLYACRWDPAALPASVQYHPITLPWSLRFLRPWFFSRAVSRLLPEGGHHLTVGFDKIWGVDVVYPQGGLHIATARHNLLKYRSPWVRRLIGWSKVFDPAYLSYLALERKQYLGRERPLVVAISEMVYRHFQEHYQLGGSDLRLVRLAPNPERFSEVDRPRRRLEWRQAWDVTPETTVALFAGLNYRLKGLEPLLHAVALLDESRPFRLLIAGGPRTGEFERLARRLKVQDRVRFLGYVNDMRNCYFAADFFVHPTFYDPCSHVVLEAMTCGLPVVTTIFNGAAEMMHPPREGLVIQDPHDHRELADALRFFLDPAHRSACAQAARRTAAGWTFEQHYRELMSVFQEGARRKRAA
jgi:UDP-glucose:(heptosyl)LPS alpha-1,3-glucosyltransferase